jgi:V8-like Glu-specific endopeptidase
VGKIFFTRGGFDYACSGASVVSSPRHVVFTAGHCLFDPETQEWSGNVLFVPAKNGKSEPYGRFGAQRVDGIEQLWVLTGWADLGELTYDMGAFSVRRNAKGRTLQQSVGALGFAYDQPRSQHWDLFGYPAVDPFGGRRMVVCEASHAVDDLSDDVGTGPDPMGVGCDMTPGSSGGPWIKDLRRGSFLNGVNSYLYAAEPAAMYSPYFGEAAQVLRCAAATGVPTTAC